MENLISCFLVFFLIAFVPSVIGAISGIGGGIIIKPVLDAISSLEIEKIAFLSSCTVLAMSCISFFRNIGTGKENKTVLEGRRGTALVLGAVTGGITGKMILNLAISSLDASFTGTVQSLVLIVLTLMVFIYMFKKGKLKKKNIRSIPGCVSLGVLMGMISTFLSIGGGPINIMLISYFLNMDTKTTVVHSIYTIFVSQFASLIFTVISGSIPAIPYDVLIAVVSGGILGGLLGSWIMKQLPHKYIDRLFCVVVAAVMLLSVYNVIQL